MEERTYSEYLKLDRLLGLQQGFDEPGTEPSADELNFIIVHQVFELWFKLVLREVRLARDHLAGDQVPEEGVPNVVLHLRRVTTIFDHMVHQWAVMETLVPQDFLTFRDKLVPASGFQSFQLREMEIVLGLDPKQREHSGFGDPVEFLSQHAGDSPGVALAREKVKAALAEPTFRSALRRWLHRAPIQGSKPGDDHDEETKAEFVSSYLQAMAEHHEEQIEAFARNSSLPPDAIAKRLGASRHQAAEFLEASDLPAETPDEERGRCSRIRVAMLFLESYRELPLLAWPRTLLDTVIELEELIVLFRTRHARMVERIIGRRIGTGGSSGVDYLDSTTRYRIFPDLGSVRTLLLPRRLLPPLRHADFYGFA